MSAQPKLKASDSSRVMEPAQGPDAIVVLTPAGAGRISARLRELEEILPELELASARDERGDDRARYLAALRERQELEEARRSSVLLEQVPDDPHVVEIGDEVTFELADGSTDTYVIVHPVEASLDPTWISSESPLSRAVLGQRPGSEVVIEAPGGPYPIRILSRRRLSSTGSRSVPEQLENVEQ